MLCCDTLCLVLQIYVKLVTVAVDVPFREYVDVLLRPQSLDTLGSGE